MRSAALVTFLAACGRIHFDPLVPDDAVTIPSCAAGPLTLDGFLAGLDVPLESTSGGTELTQNPLIGVLGEIRSAKATIFTAAAGDVVRLVRAGDANLVLQTDALSGGRHDLTYFPVVDLKPCSAVVLGLDFSDQNVMVELTIGDAAGTTRTSTVAVASTATLVDRSLPLDAPELVDLDLTAVTSISVGWDSLVGLDMRLVGIELR